MEVHGRWRCADSDLLYQRSARAGGSGCPVRKGDGTMSYSEGASRRRRNVERGRCLFGPGMCTVFESGVLDRSPRRRYAIYLEVTQEAADVLHRLEAELNSGRVWIHDEWGDV